MHAKRWWFANNKCQPPHARFSLSIAGGWSPTAKPCFWSFPNYRKTCVFCRSFLVSPPIPGSEWVLQAGKVQGQNSYWATGSVHQVHVCQSKHPNAVLVECRQRGR